MKLKYIGGKRDGEETPDIGEAAGYIDTPIDIMSLTYERYYVRDSAVRHRSFFTQEQITEMEKGWPEPTYRLLRECST